MSNTSSISPAKMQILKHFSHIQRVDESVFLGLQVAGGQILLPGLVLTFLFSRNVHRNPVFINFCCSWILSSIIYSLLVYRGRSEAPNLSLRPSVSECLVQASLMNGVQAMTACTTISIAIQLLSIILYGKKRAFKEIATGSRTSTWTLLVLPYMIFSVFAIVSAVLGHSVAKFPGGDVIPGSNLAVPGAFYCVILLNSADVTTFMALTRAPIYFSLVISIMSLCLEACAAVITLRNRQAFRGLPRTDWARLLTRIIVFSLYRLGLLCLMFASPLIANPPEFFLTGDSKDPLYNGVIDFMQATVPLVVFLVFASEKDVLDAWCFWRWEKSAPVLVANDKGEDSGGRHEISEV